jgi:chromosome segregation ATPase
LRNILHKYNNEIERILDEKSVNELLQEIFRYSDVTQCIHALQNEEKIESYIDHVATVIEEINDLCKDISNLNIVVPNIDVPRQRCKDLYTRYKEKVKILVARFSIEDKEQELRGLLEDMNKDLKEYCQLLWDSTREVEKFDNKIIEPLSRCNNINNRVVELSNNIGLKK